MILSLGSCAWLINSILGTWLDSKLARLWFRLWDFFWRMRMQFASVHMLEGDPDSASFAGKIMFKNNAVWRTVTAVSNGARNARLALECVQTMTFELTSPEGLAYRITHSINVQPDLHVTRETPTESSTNPTLITTRGGHVHDQLSSASGFPLNFTCCILIMVCVRHSGHKSISNPYWKLRGYRP